MPSFGGLLSPGKRGCLLRTPKLLPAERGELIEAELLAILQRRREFCGEMGCPAAAFTDNILRDKNMRKVFERVFPVAMSDPATATIFCQDIIHRYWHFQRQLLPRSHPDRDRAQRDVKELFGRLT